MLTFLGLPFEVMVPPFVEQVKPHLPAGRQAAEFARGKARSSVPQYPDALILGSDTLISLDSEVLGKPRDLIDAGAMLRRMSGRTHTIFTAVALVEHTRGFCDVQVATVGVFMKTLDENALAAYLQTEESLGKAGAYSIQGAGGTLSIGSKVTTPPRWDFRYVWSQTCCGCVACRAQWMWIDSMPSSPIRTGLDLIPSVRGSVILKFSSPSFCSSPTYAIFFEDVSSSW